MSHPALFPVANHFIFGRQTEVHLSLNYTIMEKQKFRILIDAPREKVWSTLWDDSTYRAWTAAFTEGSHAKTDWKKGSKVLFLDGKNDGMVSTIAENKPAEYMSI